MLGAEVVVHVVEDMDDAEAFGAWVDEHKGAWVAVDTEATGLNVYATDWRLRSVQIGTKREAWVLWVEGSYAGLRPVVQAALLSLPKQLAHNRAYDAGALEVSGFRHRLWEGHDTLLMSHLVDTRGVKDGGVGHKLKDLGAFYVDPSMADSDVALKEWARSENIPLDERFRRAPCRLPELEEYAGIDTMITSALYEIFDGKLIEREHRLLEFEEALQRVCADMGERGLLLDVPYAEALREHLLDREDILRQKMDAHGIENPSAPAQIRYALRDAGLTLLTPTGKLSVSKDALEGVAHPVAQLVQDFRHVSKFRGSYVERSLELVDAAGRVHPSIRSLQARTARMAVSDPPLHQLPATDALIRRMYIADPGMAIVSADYNQVELNVVAELAGERNMLKAIMEGVDLHTNTANLTGLTRKVAKMVNFLIVYGGGVAELMTKANISKAEAVKALAAFHRAFPGIRRYGNRLQERTGKGAKPLVNPAGLSMRLDKDRTYAAINYMVQSTARYVLAEAMLELAESKFSGGLLLPIHDEMLAQVPIVGAQESADEIGAIMSRSFGGIELVAEGEVYGPSWGHGYISRGVIPIELERWFV